MAAPTNSDITRLLRELTEGTSGALDRLIPVVYEELRRISHRQLRHERPGRTLDTTALVHEAYLKLVHVDEVQWHDRAHFYAVAARVMRRILIDHARARKRQKRGGGLVRVSFGGALDVPVERVESLLALDKALKRLEERDERQCRVVESRFFAGLSVEETAAALGVSAATVKRDWARARAWLNRELSPPERSTSERRARLDSIADWMRHAEARSGSEPVKPLLLRLRAGLRGRYRVEREIARGGMAVVLRGEDLEHARAVAIKVLRPSLGLEVGCARFVREIRIASHLDHPGIVPVYDSGEADGLLYYVMPHVEGESMRDRLDREGVLETSETLRIVRDVADALDHAHRHGVIHRDVKPGNVLLRDGRAMVTDFGIARAVGLEELTRTGVLLGTPAYVSPEQVEGWRELDGRSDVYSLACVTYEMLAGEPPFTGRSVGEVLHRHRTTEPPRLRSRRPDVPRKVDAAIRTALAKSPDDRFPTARAFAEALVRD